MNQSAHKDIKISPSGLLSPIRKKIASCIQCGTCTGSCPNAFAMDYTPRQLWRLILMGKEDLVFQSKTFSLCSSCYCCTLRCPRGLPLTEAMTALKQIAYAKYPDTYRRSASFYKSFMESVRRHGRVRETELMMLYFLSSGNPFLSFSFAPLGLRLMLKNKISIQFPSKGTSELDSVFRKVEQLEKEDA